MPYISWQITVYYYCILTLFTVMHVHDEANFHYSLMLLTYHDLILQHITECNAAADVSGRNLPHWPSEFYTQHTSCVLCHSILSQPADMRVLSEAIVNTFSPCAIAVSGWTARLSPPSNECCHRHKVGSAQQICFAIGPRYTLITLLYKNWHAGIFNVSNKLFVALDVLYDMRHHVKLGEPPGNCAHSVLQTSCLGRGAVQLGKSLGTLSRSSMMGTLPLKPSQQETGMLAYMGFVALHPSLKVEMGIVRTARHSRSSR